MNRPSHTDGFRTRFIVGAVTAGLALALSVHRSGVPVIAATASERHSTVESPFCRFLMVRRKGPQRI